MNLLPSLLNVGMCHLSHSSCEQVGFRSRILIFSDVSFTYSIYTVNVLDETIPELEERLGFDSFTDGHTAVMCCYRGVSLYVDP